MDFFKKHVDTVIILGAFATSVLWMNHQFNEVGGRFGTVDARFAAIEKDLAIIKTVLVMKQIMPVEMTCSKEEK